MLTEPQFFLDILDSIADSIVWVNVYSEIEGCNLAFAKLVNRPRQALLQLPLPQILQLEQQGQPLPLDQHPLTLATSKSAQGTGYYSLKQNNQHYALELSWAKVGDNDTLKHTVLTLRITPPWGTDATQRDPLTGLANRAFVVQWLENFVKHPIVNDVAMVLMIDIERFKVINNGLGYDIGDQLLVAIAQRIQQCLNPNDILARLSGDKFCILTTTNVHPELTLVEQLQYSMSQPFIVGTHSILITLSIGVLPDTSLYQSASDILRDAEHAMYRAKSKGRGRYEVFQGTFHRSAAAQLQFENDLQQAVKHEQFVLNYQPIISIRSQRLLGFEALVRWNHPTRGIILPGSFIPLAEETGLIVPLGWWVLRQACLQLKEWQVQFQLTEPIFVSVNISGRQFTQPNLVENIQQILDDVGLQPRCLKLEITESMLIERVDSVIALLNRLKAIGVQISVDDFGTGYSSLGYINQFPIDTLKIDRSFVRNVESDPEKLEIVKTIVMLAWNLGMDVIAEGVENQKQMHQLKALQCESGQGFFFAKPLDVVDATDFLANTTLPPN